MTLPAWFTTDNVFLLMALFGFVYMAAEGIFQLCVLFFTDEGE